jgi:thiol-disulfide isomerase/thioredoxin
MRAPPARLARPLPRLRVVPRASSNPQPSTPPPALALTAAAAAVAAALALSAPSGPSLADVAARAVPIDVARAAGKPAVVEFFAPYCAVCKELAPEAASVAARFESSISYVLLNADNPAWAPELGEWGVRGVPHFVFLDAAGRPVGAAVGRLPPGELTADAEALAAGRAPGRGAGGGELTPLRGPGGGGGAPAAAAPKDHGVR